MVREVKVYFEGSSTGANCRGAKIEARTRFESLAARLGLARMPRFIPCGSRRDAYEDFCIALRDAKKETLPLLLVDSEDPVTSSARWEHVLNRAGDGWEKPAAANEDHIFLMVQCMETWLIADVGALERFYHNEGFLPKCIPARKDVENVGKALVYKALADATARCGRKGSYHKGRHSWKLLALIDPSEVEKKSPNAKRFFDALRKHCGKR